MHLQTDPEATDENALAGKSTMHIVQMVTRREAALFMTLAFAMAGFLFFLGPQGEILPYVGSFFFLLFGSVFLIHTFFPHRIKSGVTLFDGGFEQFMGAFQSRKVYFSDITRIDAVQTGGGSQGDEVMLVFYGAGKPVRLGENDLFGTDLHHRVFALPGFKPEEYALAANHELKGFEYLIFKKFDVFEKV